MSTGLLIFIAIQLLTTIVSTAKTILTVQASKTTASIVNAFSYTLGAIMTKLITKQDLEIIVIVTFFSNLIGVYIAKLVIEKARKTRLWIVNATVKSELREQVEKDLLDRSIQYTLLKARNNRDFFTIFSNSKGESILIKEILEKYDVKHSIIESEHF